MIKALSYTFLCLALLLGAPPSASALTPAEQQQFADGLFARGLYEMALKEYETLLAVELSAEQQGTVLYRAAESCRKLKRPKEAAAYYLRLVASGTADKYTERAGLRLAEMRVSQGKYKEAIVLTGDLLKSTPAPAVAAAALYYQAQAYGKLNQTAPAAERYSRLVKEYSTSPFAAYAAMELAAGLGDSAADRNKAAELYRLASEKAPTRSTGAEATFALAQLMYEQEQWEEAAQAYRRLRREFINSAPAKNALLQAAWAEHHAGHFEQCLAVTEQVSIEEKKPNAPVWLYLEANCFRQLKRTREANTRYRFLQHQFANSEYASYASYELALIAYDAKDYIAVVDQAQHMLKEDKLRLDGHWLLAETYKAMVQPDNAEVHYRKIADEFATSARAPEAIFNLAQMKQAAGKTIEAAALYDRAAAFAQHPLAPRARFSQGFCLASGGKIEEAAKSWSALASAWPEDPLASRATYQKALALMKLKQHPAALKAFQSLLAQQPPAPLELRGESAYWAALIHERDGENEPAEKLLREALKVELADELQGRISYRLALVLQRQEKMDEAADFLQAVLDQPVAEEIQPSLLQWLARYRLEKNQPEEAIAAARILQAEKFDGPWRHLGCALAGAGWVKLDQEAEAVAAYRQALGFKVETREGTEGALYLGAYLTRTRAYDEATEVFNAAAASAGQLGTLDLQARAYLGLGQNAEAADKLADAARSYMTVALLHDDPQVSPEALYRAAASFEKLGKSAEQAKALDELKQRYPDSDWARKAGLSSP